MVLSSFAKSLAVAALLFSAIPITPAHAQKIRVGYWPSGLTLGYGSVLEAGDFFKKQGLEVEYVHFSDVNGTTRAIAANAIDLAFGSPAAGSFSLITDGVPVKIILATQPANVEFVVPVSSSVKSISELRGKKIAMSPAGSSTAAIAGAILKLNYGISSSDFSLVPGNEPRLVQFLAQKDVDAAALRNVTIAQLKDLKVRSLGTFTDEWRKLTKSDSVPYNAVAVIRSDWQQKNPAASAKVVVALRQALEYGKANPAQVVAAVRKAANLPEDAARVYADLWDKNYRVTFTQTDQKTLQRMFSIFKESGLLKGSLPKGALDSTPYDQSLQLK